MSKSVWFSFVLFACLATACLAGSPIRVTKHLQDVDGDGVQDIGYVITTHTGATRSRHVRTYCGIDGHEIYAVTRTNASGGDLDDDGVVGTADLALLLGHIQRADANSEALDLNQDGVLDAHDVVILIDLFGEHVAQGGGPCGGQIPCSDGVSCPPCDGNGTGLDDSHHDLKKSKNPRDGSNGGGGNSNNNNNNEPDPQCSVLVEGPDLLFAGESGSFSLDVPGEIIWLITSGGDLIDIPQSDQIPHMGSSLSLTAGPKAGEVELLATVMQNGEVVCIADHSFEIESIDLDIDSDNNNGYDPPDRSDQEEDTEEEEDADNPGKLTFASTGDFDDDGVPDFADGINLHGNSGADAANRFVPIILEIPEAVAADAMITFNYAASLPSGVLTAPDEFGDSFYLAAPHSLRVWIEDGPASRDVASVSQGGDFVEPGVELTPAQLGGGTEIMLYVEAVRPSTAIADLSIEVTVTAGGIAMTDSVRLTAIPRVLLGYNQASAVQVLGLKLKPMYTDGATAEGPLYAGELSQDLKLLFVGSDGPNPHAISDPTKDIEHFKLALITEPGDLAPELSPTLITANEDPDEVYWNVFGPPASIHAGDPPPPDPDGWVDPNPGNLVPDGFEAQFEIFLSDKYDDADPTIDWLEREAFELRGLMYGGRGWKLFHAKHVWRDGNRILVEDSLSPEEAADAYYAYLKDNYGPNAQPAGASITNILRYYGELYNAVGLDRAAVGDYLARHWGLVDQLASDYQFEVYTVGIGFTLGSIGDVGKARHVRFAPGNMANPAVPLVIRKWFRGSFVEQLIRGAFNLAKNTVAVTAIVDGVLVRTIPDVILQGRAVVEIKDVIKLSRLRQLRAQGQYAWDEGLDYIVMVTNRTKNVTGPRFDFIKKRPIGPNGEALSPNTEAKRILLRRNVDQGTYDKWVFDDAWAPQNPGTLKGQWVPITADEVEAILGL